MPSAVGPVHAYRDYGSPSRLSDFQRTREESPTGLAASHPCFSGDLWRGLCRIQVSILPTIDPDAMTSGTSATAT